MIGRQIRIFVNTTDPSEGWAERLLASVLKPALAASEPGWFWFSRYRTAEDFNDTDEDALRSTPGYIEPNGIARSIRIRFSTDEEFERALLERLDARRGELWSAGIIDYDASSDHCWEMSACSERLTLLCHQASKLALLYIDECGALEMYAEDVFSRAEHLLDNICGLRDWRATIYNMVRADARRYS